MGCWEDEPVMMGISVSDLKLWRKSRGMASRNLLMGQQ